MDGIVWGGWGGAGDGASVVEEDEAGRGGEIGCERERERGWGSEGMMGRGWEREGGGGRGERGAEGDGGSWESGGGGGWGRGGEQVRVREERNVWCGGDGEGV